MMRPHAAKPSIHCTTQASIKKTKSRGVALMRLDALLLKESRHRPKAGYQAILACPDAKDENDRRHDRLDLLQLPGLAEVEAAHKVEDDQLRKYIQHQGPH